MKRLDNGKGKEEADDAGDYGNMYEFEEEEYEYDVDSHTNHSDFAHNLFMPEDLQPDMQHVTKSAQPTTARFVPFNPNCDVTHQRPGYQIVDNVSYYNLGALVVLLYANVSEGISIPAVFDAEKQSM